MKEILEEIKEIALNPIWEDEQAEREAMEATMGYGTGLNQNNEEEDDDKHSPIKRKTEEEIENDNLDLSDQLLKTKDPQRDYEEEVAKLIKEIVDKEKPVNELIKYILKNKRKFKKKK